MELDPHTVTWTGVPAADRYGIANRPYGVAVLGGAPRVVVRIGDRALDVTAASAGTGYEALFAAGTLDPLLAAGRPVWSEARAAIGEWLTDPGYRDRLEPHLHAVDALRLRLPFAVADYVDFYASEQHATNVGRIFRPDGEPLTPNWRHLPIGYHGRAGTVVVSGTPVVRPRGQYRRPDGTVEFGPSRRLDIEAELGFVVGTPSRLGEPVPVEAFREHVFGVTLVNDWSARDIQAWEYVPLGPFLGKSFATSVSAWVTPLEALDAAWIEPPAQSPPPLPYLEGGLGLDVAVEVRLNGTVVARPPAAALYWTPAQMLAHLTVNGASLRTGDLYASGTISGAERGQWGSLLELTRNGAEPLALADGATRGFLEDGDEVVITATAPTPSGHLALGEVRGRVLAG